MANSNGNRDPALEYLPRRAASVDYRNHIAVGGQISSLITPGQLVDRLGLPPESPLKEVLMFSLPRFNAAGVLQWNTLLGGPRIILVRGGITADRDGNILIRREAPQLKQAIEYLTRLCGGMPLQPNFGWGQSTLPLEYLPRFIQLGSQYRIARGQQLTHLYVVDTAKAMKPRGRPQNPQVGKSELVGLGPPSQGAQIQILYRFAGKRRGLRDHPR